MNALPLCELEVGKLYHITGDDIDVYMRVVVPGDAPACLFFDSEGEERPQLVQLLGSYGMERGDATPFLFGTLRWNCSLVYLLWGEDLVMDAKRVVSVLSVKQIEQGKTTELLDSHG